MSNIVPSSAASKAIQPSALLASMSLQNLGQVFAESGFFNDSRSAAQAIVKIIAGAELGFGPMAAMLGVYIVKGRPSMSANFMLAAVLKTKRYKYDVKKVTNTEASIEFFRRDEPGLPWESVGTSTFTAEDAKAAGLLSQDNYRKFPRNMLFARAAANGCRWFCPDAFCGITPYTPDEVSDDVRIDDQGEYTVKPEPVVTVVPARTHPVADAANKQRQDYLEQLIVQTKVNREKLFSHYKVTAVSEMDNQAVESAIMLLEARRG